MKKFFIQSYGCQMNVYDSERMGELLHKDHYVKASKPEEADLIILNTCHIRQKAQEKIYSALGRIKQYKKSQIIGVAGCVAQAQGEEIAKRARNVDLIFGPQTIQHLPQMLLQHQKQKQKKPIIKLALDTTEKFSALSAKKRKPLTTSPTAFVSVQEGCDKFCSFCVVPYTRGGEVSRPLKDIIDEINVLLDEGIKEVTLLGQNVNAWRYGNQNFACLLAHCAKLDGLKRLRFTTSHPCDMNEELVALYGREEKLMPYLHLPLQSGSDRILQLMGRKHTRQDYLDIIKHLRQVRGDIALSSDFIVGFPSETDQDFDDTLFMVEKVQYAQAYSFSYSARPGTPASLMDSQIPQKIKTKRLARLQNLLSSQQMGFNRSKIGDVLPVLFERIDYHFDKNINGNVKTPDRSLDKTLDETLDGNLNKHIGKNIDKHHTDKHIHKNVNKHNVNKHNVDKYIGKYQPQLTGRSAFLQRVHIPLTDHHQINPSKKMLGQIKNVLITKAGKNSLQGVLVPS